MEHELTELGNVPARFGLRAFPGRTFRINFTYSYRDEQGTVQVVLDVQQADGEWIQFGRDALDMLRRQIVKH